jgi:ferredoxin
MATHAITIVESGVTYRCPDSKTVLQGMECLGKKGIPVGCRGGGCGVCKVQILEGTFSAEIMSAEHVSPGELGEGKVLACRVRPTSDLVLRVLGAMKKSVLREVAGSRQNLEIQH